MIKFKVRYMTTEIVPHVYCQMFVRHIKDDTFALLGNLTMWKSEFAEFRKLLESENVEFVYQEPTKNQDEVRNEDNIPTKT